MSDPKLIPPQPIVRTGQRLDVLFAGQQDGIPMPFFVYDDENTLEETASEFIIRNDKARTRVVIYKQHVLMVGFRPHTLTVKKEDK